MFPVADTVKDEVESVPSLPPVRAFPCLEAFSPTAHFQVVQHTARIPSILYIAGAISTSEGFLLLLSNRPCFR